MANHKSALKAHRQNLKRRDHNRRLRTRMRHALKSARAAIDEASANSENTPDALAELRTTVALIDTLAGKGVIHTNAASRHKSRLTRHLIPAIVKQFELSKAGT